MPPAPSSPSSLMMASLEELPDIRLSSSDFLCLEEALNSGPFAEFAGIDENTTLSLPSGPPTPSQTPKPSTHQSSQSRPPPPPLFPSSNPDQNVVVNPSLASGQNLQEQMSPTMAQPMSNLQQQQQQLLASATSSLGCPPSPTPASSGALESSESSTSKQNASRMQPRTTTVYKTLARKDHKVSLLPRLIRRGELASRARPTC